MWYTPLVFIILQPKQLRVNKIDLSICFSLFIELFDGDLVFH